MSAAVVGAFPIPSKVDQENRLKSRKLSKQSGLKPPNRPTENRGSSKRYSSLPHATPRRALNELSGNVPSTPWQSDAKRQGHTAVGIVPTYAKRQGTSAGTSTKKSKVEKPSKLSSEDFPDIEALPNSMSTSVEPPLASPLYFKELSFALKHTTYMPQTLRDLPQQLVVSLSIPRRPLSTPHDTMTIPDDDVETIDDDGSLLDLPELPNFDF